MHDASPRVHIGGLHADYWEGLAHLKDGASSNGSDSHGALASTTQTTSIFWLGSSIGNFRREDAVEFLKNVHLAPGDTMLIGIDSCDDVEMIETAYDDPEVSSVLHAWGGGQGEERELIFLSWFAGRHSSLHLRRRRSSGTNATRNPRWRRRPCVEEL
jgi:hypothetical protein